jgi:hypothetical protein
VDNRELIRRAKMISKGLQPSPIHEKIANVATDYMESDLSTRNYLKQELKGLKRKAQQTINNPKHGLQGLLGSAIGQAITAYAPEGVYLNPQQKRLGYKTDSSNIYLEEPKTNELFRIGGEISF